MDDANAELRRRRDRARHAQHNFRRREADKAAALSQNYTQLERLLGGIVRAHDGGDQEALSKAIAEAGAVFHGQTDPQTSRLRNIDPTRAADLKRPAQICHRRQNSSKVSGRFSPRLDYCLLQPDADRFLKIFDPPSDIRPYVGQGRYGVAGYITWTCLDNAVAMMHTAAMTQSNANYLLKLLPPTDTARRLFDVALRHSKPLHDVAYMMMMLEARLEFRKLGYMRSDNKGADEASRQLLEESVQSDLRARGVQREHWWTALNIETHIQRGIGPLRFSDLQQALQRQQESSIQMIMPLAQILATRAICFGDGPRWNVQHTTMLVNTWVKTVAEIL